MERFCKLTMESCSTNRYGDYLGNPHIMYGKWIDPLVHRKGGNTNEDFKEIKIR